MLLRRTAGWWRRCGVVAVLCLGYGLTRAQAPKGLTGDAGVAGFKSVSPAEYRAHLDALRQLVAECGRVVTACDVAKVGDDDRVTPPDGPVYFERYGWLRTLMEDRNDPGHKLRLEMLPRAEQRLAEQEAELDAPVVGEAVTEAQRAARAEVLRRSEFRTDKGYSLSEVVSEWISRQLAKMFQGVSTVGRSVPWLGTAVEWGLLILALALLVLWVYRALDRQRIALGKLHGDASREAQLAESRMWAQQARQHAERGAWREAVHALYWASIVVLEDRRTLRRSGTRTPREALRLVEMSSPLGTLLRAQTGNFERIWYGLQPASAGDYESALQQYEAMQSAQAKAGAA